MQSLFNPFNIIYYSRFFYARVYLQIVINTFICRSYKVYLSVL